MSLAPRIIGMETEYGITVTGARQPETGPALGADEAARYLFRRVVEWGRSSNVFLRNGGRLYLDVGSHPEYATAECDDVRDVVVQDRAGEAILDELTEEATARLAADGIGGRIHLLKNNVDAVGNGFGCHENYLVRRRPDFQRMVDQLVPFFITRQILTGAGAVRRSAGGAAYTFSQRSEHMWDAMSSATTRSRPIINTRDEPHGDSNRFRRMHVIVGDSNMSEPTFALKVGSTLLVLEMIEAGVALPDFEMDNPIGHIRDIARDMTGSTPLLLKDGGTVTALEVQEATLAAATDWLGQRPDEGTPTAELRRVVDLWTRQLEAVRTQDFSRVDREIDWVIKLNLLNRYRERVGEDWAHPKLSQVDLAYHDIRPGRGLFPLLEARGMVDRWTDDAAIEAAVGTAPETTRAHLRGRFITAAEELGAPVTIDWVHLKVNDPEPRAVELLDPFQPVDERVDDLLAYLEENAGSYGRV